MNCSGSFASEFKHCLRHASEAATRHLRSRGPRHWVIVAGLLIGGTFAGHQLGKSEVWIELRYSIYQRFLQVATLRQPYPKRTVMVMIDDDGFWGGPFQHRTPLRRDLLAELLLKIDAANPEVVALDIDLRSHPAGPGAHATDPAYEGETQALLGAINAVSRNRTVVLA
jgi:CHASE2 domain-containing sensor protein